MYSPAFQTLLIDARIEDLRRSRGTSIQSRLSLAGMRRLLFADPSRAN